MKAKRFALYIVLIGVGMFVTMGATRAVNKVAQRDGAGDGQPRPFAQFVASRLARWMAFRSEINITSDQRTQIHQVIQNHKAEIAPAATLVVEKRRALREAVMADSADETAIRTAADDLGKAAGDMAVVASKVVVDIKPILTAEQIEQLRKFQAERDQTVDGFLGKLAGGQ